MVAVQTFTPQVDNNQRNDDLTIAQFPSPSPSPSPSPESRQNTRENSPSQQSIHEAWAILDGMINRAEIPNLRLRNEINLQGESGITDSTDPTYHDYYEPLANVLTSFLEGEDFGIEGISLGFSNNSNITYEWGNFSTQQSIDVTAAGGIELRLATEQNFLGLDYARALNERFAKLVGAIGSVEEAEAVGIFVDTLAEAVGAQVDNEALPENTRKALGTLLNSFEGYKRNLDRGAFNYLLNQPQSSLESPALSHVELPSTNERQLFLEELRNRSQSDIG